MAARFNISSEVSTVLPEHVESNSPDLNEFLSKFIEFMETENKSLYHLNTVANNRDIDYTEEQFLSMLQNEIGQPIPRKFTAEPRLLYKHLTELYKSRGTIDSIKAFFRLLFDDEVEIYFPKDDMFIPSDGKWFSKEQDIIDDPSNHTPSFKYTISAVTDTVSGRDDNNSKLLHDDPLIYKNGTRVTDAVTSVKEFAPPNWATGTDYLEDDLVKSVADKLIYRSIVDLTNSTTDPANDSTNWESSLTELEYSIKFSSNLAVNDVIEVYTTGSFSVHDGFMSDRMKLQDSFFYQQFSYVCRTGSNAELWKNAFNRLIHPAGFIFFGEILLVIYLIDSNRVFSMTQPGRQTGGLPIPIIIPLTNGKSSWNKTYSVWTKPGAYTDEFGTFIIKSYKFLHYHKNTLIADPTNIVPNYTYTISTATDTVTGNDDAGNTLEYFNPLNRVIYVNDILIEDVTHGPGSGSDHYIKFSSNLAVNDVVKVYNTGSFQKLSFGMREYFERFKFRLYSPINDWSNTLLSDVDAKIVDGTIESDTSSHTISSSLGLSYTHPDKTTSTVPLSTTLSAADVTSLSTGALNKSITFTGIPLSQLHGAPTDNQDWKFVSGLSKQFSVDFRNITAP
jgi:hypothetical protein